MYGLSKCGKKKMTVPKALKLLDWWIAQRERVVQEFLLNCKDSEVVTTIRDSEKTIIANLKLIRDELIPKCMHPKKMWDTCAGQKYCMHCNSDLPNISSN